MRKLFFALMAITAIVLTGCKDDTPASPQPTPIKPSGVTWTDDQWKTIQSLRQVDNMGYLYEMNCLFDYKIQEVLDANTKDLPSLIDAIKNVILKESKTNFTEILGGGNMDTICAHCGGCTCFSMAGTNGGYILGRNYDFPPADDHTLIVHTPQVKDASGNITRYATVGTCDLGILTQFLNEENGYQTPRMQELALYAPYFILDGLNDQGLMSGLMVLEYDGTYQQESGKTNLTNAMITRVILDNCATVEQAIAMLGKFNIVSIFQTSLLSTIPWIDMHFAFADKNGDRAIIEWTENTMRVLRGDDLKTQCRKQTNPESPQIKPQTREDYVIATNYYLSKDAMDFPIGIALGNEMGFWRHDVVDSLLNLTSGLTAQKAMDICYAARIMKNDPDCIAKLKALMEYRPLLDVDNKNDWPWITIWSSVYDNKNMSVLFCSREDFTRRYELGLRYK
ncbi:MAG: linear amide C-N hydrolase [Paludibacteraceae bacterium]|nr:linear amide C-N hydrolase [Paludibacteraceae bacterium]